MNAGYPAPPVNSPGLVIVEGSFDCNGASAPVALNGDGFSVSAPSTGVYTVTLTKFRQGEAACYQVINATANLFNEAAGGNDAVRITATSTLTTGRTFTLETQSSDGTAANLAVGRVGFRLVLQRSKYGAQ